MDDGSEASYFLQGEKTRTLSTALRKNPSGVQMLTKKGKYGLKAMVHLAGRLPGEATLVTDIAISNQIPKKFLDTILGRAAQRGFCQLKERQGRRLHAGSARLRDPGWPYRSRARWPARPDPVRQQGLLSPLRRLQRRAPLRRAADHARSAQRHLDGP
ncbi:protein of unknown function [Methylocella tundrae]|uniref:Uncharacterized protein n=1 Tax=Methylocella tundrae TaxID=227605 RepID=A0A4U8YYB3_METTU|nr:protein of unknown function [Methylocella tundrae]